MMIVRRRLACCTRDREISFDFDEQERIMAYNGLESCILNNQSYESESLTSRGDGCATDSLDEDASSCSSSTNAFGSSFSSHWTMMKREEHGLDEWDLSESEKHLDVKEKAAYTFQVSDLQTMKEKFAKLLLGEDITGGRKGISTALALSNAITNLAATIFGELWKLEPLSEDRKEKWQREMDWLISPTNYMVELVPAKQNSANGRTMEIMMPKARADIHMNLPALQKLDSMLIETLDSMVNTEFWYSEGGSRGEGRSTSGRHSRRWWLPSPRVPTTGLTDTERTKILHQGKVVHQVLKAAKSINGNVLLEMPVPKIIRDALPKSGKVSLGEELYKILTSESMPAEEMLNSLKLKSEHNVLEAMNRLEVAVFSWKERINEQTSGKSPGRSSWSFMKDPISELDRMEFLCDRAESLLQQLKNRYPNLPQSFLDVTKIQYGKDVGHSILEAYSRVLGNLAFSILSRIADILQEDVLSNPSSPAATCCFPGTNLARISDTPVASRVRHSLLDQMNSTDGEPCDSNSINASDSEVLARATPSRSRVWCITREVCVSVSPQDSP